MKIILLFLFFYAIFCDFVLSQTYRNGIRYDSNNNFYEVGDNSLNYGSDSRLRHDTYFPLNGFHLWFFDSATPIVPVTSSTGDRFTIGNNKYLKNPWFTSYDYAKFTVSNINEYNSAFISSNSPYASTVLWVNHTNWTFNTTNTVTLYGTYSHIGYGAKDTNIAVYGDIDSSLASRENIAVKGRVSKSQGGGINYGFFSDLSDNPVNAPADKGNYGFWSILSNNRQQTACWAYTALINDNYGSDDNQGLHINVSENQDINGTPNLQQINKGIQCGVGNNNNSRGNYGLDGIVNWNTNYSNPNSIQENYGIKQEVNCNYGAAKNIGTQFLVSENNGQNNYTNVNQNNYGIYTQVQNNEFSYHNYGLWSISEYNGISTGVNYFSQINKGVWGQANYNNNSDINIGVEGDAINDSSNINNIGVFGWAYWCSDGIGSSVVGSNSSTYGNPVGGNIGVYGYAGNNASTQGPYDNFTNGTNVGGSTHILDGVSNNPYCDNIAGFFDGNVVITGVLAFPSDELLKKNIKPLKNDTILNKMSLIKPKRYFYDVDKNSKSIVLPKYEQFGLIAQEVSQIYPNLVVDIVKSVAIDSGKVKSSKTTFKGINYCGFIPILIESVNELKQRNDTLDLQIVNVNKNHLSIKTKLYSLNKSCNAINYHNDKLIKENDIRISQNDSLKYLFTNLIFLMGNNNSILSDCCNGIIRETISDNILLNDTDKLSTVSNNITDINHNNLNPLNDVVTFNYSLGISGFVELEITNQNGQVYAKVVNMNQNIGDYSVNWVSSKISTGIYYYSLKVNGLQLVEKALIFN